MPCELSSSLKKYELKSGKIVNLMTDKQKCRQGDRKINGAHRKQSFIQLMRLVNDLNCGAGGSGLFPSVSRVHI